MNANIKIDMQIQKGRFVDKSCRLLSFYPSQQVELSANVGLVTNRPLQVENNELRCI